MGRRDRIGIVSVAGVKWNAPNVFFYVVTISVLNFSTKMEKVSLYDPEKDIVIDINLSSEDVLRAQQDMTFATSLLNAALKERESTKNVESSIESDLTQKISKTNVENFQNDTDDSGSMYRWSTTAVLLLLDTYKTFQDKFSSGKYSHKKIWDEISITLVEKGHLTTGPQCAAKLRSLKKTYKSVKDHNNLSGNDRRTWQFYEIMNEIFSKKAWCSPVAVASSTGLSIKQDKDSGFIETISDSSEGKVCSPKTRESSKENVCSLLKRKLLQKTEQEEAKVKRHKERMEMDEKFLSVLTKLVEK
ncbi:uncharacterized protein [Linepithema humile]|uniref:uncharacterized protein n=1 Tax=Linepithema humile TaxID=83485 RepID=UPI00062311F8|nr:PREDICTED: uncharacterized protein LOC105669268 [Linepithema humile]